MSDVPGYHFGGCCACRAPILPATDFFYEPDCQAVFYLQTRFHRLSVSDFTGAPNRGHLLTCSHYSYAYAFACEMPIDRIPCDMKREPLDSPPLNGTNCMTQRPAARAARGARADVDSDDDGDDAAAPGAAGGAHGNTKTLIGQWDCPLPFAHPELAGFLGVGSCKTPLDFDLDFTALICRLCNDIFDTWSRMGAVLTKECITLPGSIRVLRAGIRAGTSPQCIPRANHKGSTRTHLGLIVGRYMHRCLVALHGDVSCHPALSDHRAYVCMALFIPLHLTCHYLECTEGPNAKRPKGQGKGMHNYLGCMDLLIAYYLFLTARVAADPARPALPLDFDRFSVFYIKELPDAPVPVWDSVLHPTLSDYVFKGAPKEPLDNLVRHASDRLMTLYKEKCVPLLPLITGAPFPLPPQTPDEKLWRETAAAFFVSAPEFDTTLTAHFDRAQPSANIAYFIQHIGIAAVVWHIRRYLLGETPRLRELLDEWTRSVLVREWANIVDNSSFALTMAQAQLVYQMQNVLRPERLLGSADALGTGRELSLLGEVQHDDVVRLIAECGRCSVFKAAARLCKWSFVTKAPPQHYALESRLAPFSARLISPSSAMIVAIDRSSAAGVADCASARSHRARRRGCKGR